MSSSICYPLYFRCKITQKDIKVARVETLFFQKKFWCAMFSDYLYRIILIIRLNTILLLWKRHWYCSSRARCSVA